MATSHAEFVWYELMTTDAQAAEDFYRGVIGWTAQDAGVPDMHYTILSMAQTAVAVEVVGGFILGMAGGAFRGRPGIFAVGMAGGAVDLSPD